MQEKHNILISSRSFGKINSGAINLLKESGFHVIMNPSGKKLNEEEILELMDDNVIGIIAGTEKITKNIIEENPNLKVISRYGIGLDNVDLESAKKNNVLIFNTPETPSYAVAELTITLMFSLLKKIYIVNENLHSGTWKPEMGNMLSGKTIGIIGLGNIGKKVVSFLKPHNVKIIAADIEPDMDFVQEFDVNLECLEELLIKSDIISIHLPLNDETHHIIDKKMLSKMKETAFLINTARGGIVDEGDLYHILLDKKIGGAAFDVFENEPNVGKLKNLDNIILSPHIATFTTETRKDMEIEATRNLIQGLKEF